MTLFALLKGNTTFKDIFAWMTFNQENEILKKVFEKEMISVPSRSTLHTLLINTDNNALEAVFREFFLDYIFQKKKGVRHHLAFREFFLFFSFLNLLPFNLMPILLKYHLALSYFV